MIYMLEDDENIREFVLYALNNNTDLEAQGFAEPASFWKAVREKVPQLILLDIMLPEEDGLTILSKLRKNPETEHIPVIMLTAKGTLYDKVIGLDSGADDYVSKPFEILELISRIRVCLRRNTENEEASEFHLGGLYVNQTKHIVKVNGENVHLSIKEFELLCILLKHQGKVFSRDQLFEKVWGEAADIENRTLDVHMRNLRSKLGNCGANIETIRGMGYKIRGDE
ncbi:MAG: winged helix-turn-helix domain-containing protein [Eubacterium sp.]